MNDEFNSKRWGFAIYQWEQVGKGHDPAPLEALLRDTEISVPDFAREFLAEMASNKLGRGGRPKEYSGKVERSIASQVFAERERLEALGPNSDPKLAACEVIAERLGKTPDSVRRMIERLAPDLTYELWKSIGRPNWKGTP